MADWETAMSNLLRRRSIGDIRPQQHIDDYQSHISKAIKMGWIKNTDRVLDVGCGTCTVLDYLGDWFKGEYIGLDPFPTKHIVLKGVIEDNIFDDQSIDVSICFAVLDGTRDLDRALSEINRITKRSIIMLTGLDIEPDSCHTHLVSQKKLSDGLPDFKLVSIDGFRIMPTVALMYWERK